MTPVVNRAVWRNLFRPREMAGQSVSLLPDLMYADINNPSMSCGKLECTKEVHRIHSQQPSPHPPCTEET